MQANDPQNDQTPSNESPEEQSSQNQVQKNSDSIFKQILKNAKTPNDLICVKCSLTFAAKSHAVRHFKEKHQMENRNFVCSYEGCNWRFKRNSHLKRHMESHVKEKKFKCPHCSRLFDLQSFLKRHIKIFHEDWEQNRNEKKKLETVKVNKEKKLIIKKEQEQQDLKNGFLEFKQNLDYNYRPESQQNYELVEQNSVSYLTNRVKQLQTFIVKLQFQISNKDSTIASQNEKLREMQNSINLLIQKNQELQVDKIQLKRKLGMSQKKQLKSQSKAIFEESQND